MSIVILVGGSCEQGNAEHRYLVTQFLEHFGDKVSQIITTRPTARPLRTRIRRLIKRGNYIERIQRARYKGGYGPEAHDVRKLLLPQETIAEMPGGDRVTMVSSHNSEECISLIRSMRPSVIVVYGTAILHEPIFDLASQVTLNMHTGLSPYYRGDSTLFWPVYFNDPERMGVTIHKLVASVDGGDIAATATVSYEPGDTEAHLFSKAVKAGTKLYLTAVEQALAGTLNCTAQDLSIGKEFSWLHRTVASEHKVLSQLAQWNSTGTLSK